MMDQKGEHWQKWLTYHLRRNDPDMFCLITVLILTLLLAACSSPLTISPKATLEGTLPSPTLESTSTPPPTDSPTVTPTDTPQPEPTPTVVPQVGLSGRIFDQSTNQPVPAAQVRVGDQTTTTNTNGRYTLTGLEPGQYVLSVTHPDYDPGLSGISTLVGGQDRLLDLALYAPETSPYPEDPMLTNPLNPNGAPTEAEAVRLAQEQGLTGEVVGIEETTLTGEYLVNYKIGDDVRAAVAEINHEVWELVDETGRKWWIIKVCGNLASRLPEQMPIATPAPVPLPPMADVVVDELSVRACTSEECAEVGTVPLGERVEVFGCLADHSWCEVSWSGGRGWCTGQSLRHLAVATVIPATTPVVPTPMPTPPVVLASGASKIVFQCKMQDCHLNDDGSCRTAPDGSVLFDIKDEICVINADGNGLTRLTNDKAQDWHPAWSPDGRQIVFARDGDIYVMNADGTGQTRLTDETGFEFEPAWSTDGRQIAFNAEGGNYGIYILNADGSGLTRLTDSGQHPAWSPDGQRIAFVLDGIQVMNSDGSNQMRLTDDGFWPTWSPDGQRIAFSSLRDGNGEIYLINADGSGLTRLTNHPEEDVRPDWSPDGQQIVFASNRDGPWRIYVVNADGGDPTRLRDGYDDYAPAWSR